MLYTTDSIPKLELYLNHWFLIQKWINLTLSSNCFINYSNQLTHTKQVRLAFKSILPDPPDPCDNADTVLSCLMSALFCRLPTRLSSAGDVSAVAVRSSLRTCEPLWWIPDFSSSTSCSALNSSCRRSNIFLDEGHTLSLITVKILALMNIFFLNEYQTLSLKNDDYYLGW